MAVQAVSMWSTTPVTGLCSDVDWVTITAGDNGLGNGTIDYAVVANTDNISRTGWLVVAGQSFTVTQAAKPFNRLAVWPGSISITLPINSQITQTLTVSNIGEGTLNWGISETSSTCDVPNDLTWLRFTPTSGSISNGPPAGLTDGFTVTADTHIVQGRPASNFGQALQMPVGYAGAACTFNFVDAAARSLMQFDLSAIPADTPIGEAILNVHVDAACFVNNGRLTIAAYRIDDSWAESTATWNSQPGFAEAYGSFVVLTAPTWYQLEITELVRGWVNGTWPNLGLMLRADSESPGSSYVLTRVAARERAAGDLASYIDLIYGREQNSDNTTVTFDSTGMTPGTYSGKLCVQSTDSDMSLVELPITAGEEVDYVLTITNTGPDSAENVTVTDDLPASVTLVSATPTQGMCDKADREVTCSLGTLANGSSTAITITVMTTITATTVDDTELTNRANVHSNTADSNSENNIDTETTTVKPRLADLSLNVTDKVDPVTQGDTIEYTVTVTNSGPYSSENVILTNTLPSRVTFVSAIPVQGTCSESNGIVTCNLDTLANGISTTIIITVTTAITGPTDVDAELTNIASIRSSTADSNSENNIGTEMTTVKPRLADLSLTVTDKVDPVTQGDTIEYTVTVTNSGPYSSENVVLTNTLPSSVTFISALPLSANCTQVDEVVTCNLDAMNDDSSENITIVVSTTDQTPGTIINTVTIASNTADPDHINNLVTEDTHVNPAPVTPAADLLVKSNNATYLRRTGSMNYTVAVTNIGPDTATNVSLTIILPTGLIPISTSQTFGHCADTDKIVTCNLGNITQGNSVSTVISVSTTGIVSGTVTSTIDVSSDTVDPNRDNNIGHPSTSIQPHMILLPLIMGRQ
ncbi:DUF11 domain-containing protein [Chloroflexi bacterium TSY]|nr:DUF11 domain-containing protein [Chloroflexi bacterium TSY]